MGVAGCHSYIDLFAGAGGWSVGFDAAGISHAGLYDVNQSACRTATRNFGSRLECVDLRDNERIDFPAVEIVCGSPPCQGFSNEGKKDINDRRNDLVWAFLDIVDRIQPRVWVFENVPGFKRSYGGYFYALLIERLRTSRYKWRDFILNAADYGVPQYRERFVLIASRDFTPLPPKPTHAAEAGLFAGATHVTLWEAISDLPAPMLGDRCGEYNYPGPPSVDYQALMREGSERLYNHTAQKHSQRVLDKIRAVEVGRDMSVLVETFAENRVHYCGGYRRARRDRPSYTAYWTRGMTSIHPEQDRFLSPRECARIQSFPDRFVFAGATIENYTQVCNAVPPLLAQAIAESLLLQLGLASKPARRSHNTDSEVSLPSAEASAVGRANLNE